MFDKEKVNVYACYVLRRRNFMNGLLIAFYVFLAIEVIAIITYIPRMSMWIKGYKSQKKLVNQQKAKFGLILAAKNEDKTIIPLLKSLNEQTYPKELYDIHLVVSQKGDSTIGYAESILDKVYIHDDIENQTRKADALDGVFKKILADKEKFNYDAFIIIDADNVLSPNFVEEMNNSLVSGADVVIPRKVCKNWFSLNKKNRNVISNCSALTFIGIDAMGNKAKSEKGYTLALCGQGMLIKYNVIEGLGGYPFKGLIEDYELSVECIKKGYKQFYYEHAIIYSEEAITHHEFNKRRIRWIQGFSQCTSNYNKTLRAICKKDKQKKKENYYFLNGLFPVYVMFATILVEVIGFIIAGIVLAFSNITFMWMAFQMAFLGVVLTYLLFFVYGIFSVTQDRDVNKMTAWEKTKLIFCYPILTFEYIWIFIQAFTMPINNKWESVKRIEM